MLCVLIFSFIHGNITSECLNPKKICVDDYCFPKVIWSHWDDHQMYKDVEEMINITKKSLENFTYCFLSDSNISDFLDIQSFPKGYYVVHPAGKADYLRVNLLSKYGGVYIDSSTYINSGAEMEWMINETIKSKSEFVTFEFHWSDGDVEFSLIGAPLNSFFMGKWKEELDLALKMGFRRYVKRTCKRLISEQWFNGSSYRCKETGYFYVDLSFQSLLSKNLTLRETALILPENRSNYKLFAECRYDRYCEALRFVSEPDIMEKYPFIKLSGMVRFEISHLKKLKAMGIGDAEIQKRLEKRKEEGQKKKLEEKKGKEDEEQKRIEKKEEEKKKRLKEKNRKEEEKKETQTEGEKEEEKKKAQEKKETAQEKKKAAKEKKRIAEEEKRIAEESQKGVDDNDGELVFDL